MRRDEIIAKVRWLIDDWCEVRNLNALREILAAYPLAGDSTADWMRLRDALQHIHEHCSEEFLPSGSEALSELIGEVERTVAH